MEEALKITKGQKSYLKKVINELKAQFENMLQDTKLKEKEIEEYYKKLLLSSEDRTSIEDQIEEIRWNFEELLQKEKRALNEITIFYNQIFVWEDDGDISKKEQIEDFFEKIKGEFEKIESHKSQIESYFDQLFWKKNEDWNYVWWLKQDLERKNNEYIELNKKIESLLPWATSAGLAYTYERQRKTYACPQRVRSIVFWISILGMLGVLYFYQPNFWGNISDLVNFSLKFLSRLAIVSPLVWLASFSSKQQSKLQRLEQEYAHKEALSRSFDWYNREIRRLENNEEAQHLLIQLLKNVVDMSWYNPSITLDNSSHESKNPVSNTIESIVKQTASVLPNLK